MTSLNGLRDKLASCTAPVRDRPPWLAEPIIKLALSVAAAVLATCGVRDVPDKVGYYISGAPVIAVLFIAFVINRRTDFAGQNRHDYRALIILNVALLLAGEVDALR